MNKRSYSPAMFLSFVCVLFELSFHDPVGNVSVKLKSLKQYAGVLHTGAM